MTELPITEPITGLTMLLELSYAFPEIDRFIVERSAVESVVAMIETKFGLPAFEAYVLARKLRASERIMLTRTGKDSGRWPTIGCALGFNWTYEPTAEPSSASPTA